MFEIDRPQTRDDIAAVLVHQRNEVERYFGSFDDGGFAEPQGEHWSPAGHLRHLIKSVRAVASAMQRPRWMLRMFGWSRRSRSFDEVVGLYRRTVAGGADAGRYAPSAAAPPRDVVMDRWLLASSEILEAIAGWDDAALDRYRLPHPLLGRMTVREMLFFTIYHNAHHARRVRERAGD